MSNRACFDTESLSRYSQGQGSRKWRTKVAAHLATCRTCAQELTALNTVADMLNRVPKREAPDQWSRIQARLQPQKPGLALLSVFARPKGWAVAAGLALVLAFAGLHVAQTPTSKPSAASHIEASDTELAQSHIALAWNDPFADSAGLAVIASRKNQSGAK